MKTILIAAILMAVWGQAEVFNADKCATLLYSDRNDERVVIEACAEVWGEMFDKRYITS